MDIMKKIVSFNSSPADTNLVGRPSTSSPASTVQFHLLDLPNDLLVNKLGDLDSLSLVKFSCSSNQAWSLVKTYLALSNTTVDLSDPSIRENITDDSLKLFSECKHINLAGCPKITDAGLAHLSQATSINLQDCEQITDAGLAHFKTSNPTCKISGR